MKLVYIIVAILLITYSQLQANTLSTQQKQNLLSCYKAGVEYDLGNTLTGICWVESKGGLYKVNPLSGDYGLPQIHVTTGLSHLNLKDTWHNRNRLATMLVEDDKLALAIAVKELKYWRDTRQRTAWHRYVSSYNQGTIINNLDYARKVAEAIEFLKKEKILK